MIKRGNERTALSTTRPPGPPYCLVHIVFRRRFSPVPIFILDRYMFEYSEHCFYNIFYLTSSCCTLRSKLLLWIRNYIILQMEKKLKAGNDQKMAQSERNFHATNRGVGKKPNELWHLGNYSKKTLRQPSERLFRVVIIKCTSHLQPCSRLTTYCPNTYKQLFR